MLVLLFLLPFWFAKGFSFCSDPFHEVKRRRDRKKEVSSQIFFFPLPLHLKKGTRLFCL